MGLLNKIKKHRRDYLGKIYSPRLLVITEPESEIPPGVPYYNINYASVYAKEN